MSAAMEFIQAGISRATTGRCLICDEGVSPVGMPGMVQLGIGMWACTCDAGRALRDGQVKRQAQAAAKTLLAGAEIPHKYEGYTFEGFRERTRKMVEKIGAAREAELWAIGQTERPWLFLWGKTGRGKTGLGVCALKTLMQTHQVEGRFISTFDMFDELKKRFGGETEAYVDALARVPVLLVDELVTPFNSAWRTQVLFELIWRRDASQLPTIWTCADETKIVESITEAGWRRVRDNSVRVELGGKEIDWGR